MDKVLLVSVIALAVALLSMLVNLALVWKISDLKNRIEWVELTVNDRTSQLHKDDVEISNQLNKLECDTKDAFEIVTNNLKLHGTLLDEMSTKFALLDGRVSKHDKQLEDLGNFAGITTGELRVLEQKIYNSYKPKELPEPEPITKQISERIEEASLKVNVKTNNIEINRLAERVSVLENKREVNITEQNDIVTRVGKLEHRVSGIYETINDIKVNMVYNTLSLNSKIVQLVGGRDVLPNEMKETLEKDIRKHKTDRKRKDNYYRKPNKSNVIIDEFANDMIE